MIYINIVLNRFFLLLDRHTPSGHRQVIQTVSQLKIMENLNHRGHREKDKAS